MVNSALQRPQLPMHASDRGLQSLECRQLWRWRAHDAQLATVHSLHGAGIQVRQAAVDAYRMPGATDNPTQGVGTAMASAAPVTNTKFSTRLGPPPDRPV